MTLTGGATHNPAPPFDPVKPNHTLPHPTDQITVGLTPTEGNIQPCPPPTDQGNIWVAPTLAPPSHFTINVHYDRRAEGTPPPFFHVASPHKVKLVLSTVVCHLASFRFVWDCIMYITELDKSSSCRLPLEFNSFYRGPSHI